MAGSGMARRLVAACLVAPCALFIHTVHAQGAPAAAPLRLGVIGPMSGGSADFGRTMVRGVELAADEINALGGYLGRPIELVVKDDRGDPDTGRRLSEELVSQDQVLATIGFCNTGVAVRAIPVFQAARVPLVVPCAAGSPITKQGPAAESYVFRVSPSEEITAPFVVQDLLRRGWKKVAIFADDTAYGQSGQADVTKALAAAGLAPVHVTRFALGTSTLNAEMARARAAGADVIVAYTVGPENAVIAKSRTAIGWKVPLAGPWTLSFPSFIDGAGASAEGAIMAQSFIAEPSNERRAAFLSAWARRYGQTRMPVPMAGAQAYDATYLLIYALFSLRGGAMDGPRLKAALEDLPRVYYGVVATYDKPFSRTSKEAVTPNMLVMGRVRGGAVTFAYAEDARRNLVVQRKRALADAP